MTKNKDVEITKSNVSEREQLKNIKKFASISGKLQSQITEIVLKTTFVNNSEFYDHVEKSLGHIENELSDIIFNINEEV